MDEGQVVAARLKLLAEYVSDLRDLQEIGLDDYQGNKLIRRAVERTLQMAVEATLDVGHHLIAAGQYRSPGSNADVFVILGEQGVLPQDLVPRLVGMARFRNLLVHDYARLDDALIYNILRHRLGDFDDFARAIAAYLENLDR